MGAGATITDLKQISGAAGAVWHGLRAEDADYTGFGEAYFSCIKAGAIKGFKCHQRMHSNLIVVQGIVRFAWADPDGGVCSVDLGPGTRYARLHLPAGLWFGFAGAAPGDSMLLNIASIGHDPAECLQAPANDPRFKALLSLLQGST